jgi:hypothetical protein
MLSVIFHNCFHLEIMFISVAARLLLRRWKQMESFGARSGLCAGCYTRLPLRNCLTCNFISHRPTQVVSDYLSVCQFNILFTRCRRWLNSPGRLVVTKFTAGFNISNSALFHRVDLCSFYDYHNKQPLFPYTEFTDSSF